MLIVCWLYSYRYCSLVVGVVVLNIIVIEAIIMIVIVIVVVSGELKLLSG